MRKNEILVYIFLALFLLSTLFLVISLGYTSLEKISAQSLDDRMQELQNKEVEFSKLEQKGEEWQNIDQTYEQFKTDFLLQYEKFSDFRNQLESIFQTNMLTSERKNYRINNLPGGIVRVTLDFNLTGSYRDIKKFLYTIEEDQRMVFLKNVSLTKTKNGVIGNFAMEAYFVR